MDLLNTPDGGLDEAIRVGKTYFRELRQERDKLRAERDALRAHVERLRAALDTARVEALWIVQNTAPSGTDSGDLSTNRAAKSMVAGIVAALSATPAQSLASVKAAALREVAKNWYRAGNPSQENAAVFLEDEADRIEKEAANG